jgi:sulfite exporter TauE/SafE
VVMALGSSFIAGGLLGLAGSLHCVGMCGPLMLLLPKVQSPLRTLSTQGIYHFGKTLTYVLLGAILGMVFLWFDIRKIEQQFSLFLGVVFLMIWFIEFWGNKKKNQSPLQNWVQKMFGKTINLRATWGWFLGGMLNGLLPCGLVYGALIASLGTGSSWGTILFMTGFGLGTSPALMGVSLGKFMLSPKWLPKFKGLLPYWYLIMAILFFLRGANLGIPFLSPKFNSHPTEAQQNKCCH